MVSEKVPTLQGDEPSAEASAAIEELIAELGLRAVLGAVLGSSLAPELERRGSGEATLRAVQWVLREVAYDKNPQLRAEIMAMGCGVILRDEETMTAMGRRWGLSRSAISKQVVNFVDEHGLPPSCYMRKEADRDKYALTNRPRVT